MTWEVSDSTFPLMLELTKESNAAINLDAAAGGGADLGQHLEQRRFTRAVVTDDADHFAWLDAETDIIQRFEQRGRFNFLASQAGGAVEQSLLETLHGPQAVFLGEVGDFNDGHVDSDCSQGG